MFIEVLLGYVDIEAIGGVDVLHCTSSLLVVNIDTTLRSGVCIVDLRVDGMYITPRSAD